MDGYGDMCVVVNPKPTPVQSCGSATATDFSVNLCAFVSLFVFCNVLIIRRVWFIVLVHFPFFCLGNLGYFD